MSLSPEARKYMDMRDSLSYVEKRLIDFTFGSIYHFSKDEDVKAATDDRAVELEAAIIKFVIESREG